MNIVSLTNKFDMKPIQTICDNSDPRVLGNYFHAQELLIDKGFRSLKQLGNHNYYKKIISFIKSLTPKQQERILFDFRVIIFFSNTNQRNKSTSLIQEDKTNLKFLMQYLERITDCNIRDLSTLNSFDQVLYVLINFREEFYKAYCLYAHFEDSKMPNSTTEAKLNLELILQNLIQNRKFTPPLEIDSCIRGFYINQLTLIDRYADNIEISINAKHVWQNNKEDEIDPLCKLLEQYNIRNAKQYSIKLVEIGVIINIPYTDKSFRKYFIANHEGETSLGFETIDEHIKMCLEKYGIIRKKNPENQLKIFFFTTTNCSSEFIFKD